MERICPHCRQSIFDEEALLCHFCGNSLGRTSSGFIGKISSGKMIIAAVVLLSLVLLFLGIR
ncbi:MAG: hypothetical protein KA403_07530 [Candidatus Omnitrophica bacterium]|nr:hypothetical protein [Candidatus Omnitrophota bacterium]